MKHYDIVVIGSGPGGYVAAARAGALGFKTAIIEKDSSLGGTCLHRGCIPTKFLLHIADTYAYSQKIKKIGLYYRDIDINWKEIMISKTKIIKKNAYGVNHILKSNNVELYNGIAELQDFNSKIKVIKVIRKNETSLIYTKNIILAVGSRAKKYIIGTPISGIRIMNSDDILNISSIPKSLVIIGGGVIGCEFASIFSNFNSEILILEHSNQLLPMADHDCSSYLFQIFNKKNVTVKTNVSVKTIEENDEIVTIVYHDGVKNIKVEYDYCLVATGRDANVDLFSSNINKLHIKKIIKDGLFQVNKHMQTSADGLYAIGDCINTPWLAHTASAEGLIAVESIANLSNINVIDYSKIPICVYSNPSIAWCGLPENKINISNDYIKISKFPLIRNGKAALMLETEGFVKCITDRETNEILGFHIIGKNATELIAEPSFVMQIEATIDEIASTIHAHPTLYESIYETALIALNKPLHG